MAGLRTPSEAPEGAGRRREAQGQPAARCGQPGAGTRGGAARLRGRRGAGPAATRDGAVLRLPSLLSRVDLLLIPR